MRKIQVQGQIQIQEHALFNLSLSLKFLTFAKYYKLNLSRKEV